MHTELPNHMIQLKQILEQLPELTSFEKEQKEEFSTEISLLLDSTRELMIIREKYADILKREAELASKVEEFKNRIFPSIYFGTVKHHTTKEPYIIARSLWKKGTNDYAQLSAYIGAVAKFPKGIDDVEVMKIAKDKIRKKIREKFPIGE